MRKYHTGPWRSGDRFNTIFGPPNGNPSPQTIATVFKGHEGNARLLSAAPELLQSVKNFFEWHANNFERFDDQTNMELLCLANEAEAAIEKAEGRQ